MRRSVGLWPPRPSPDPVKECLEVDSVVAVPPVDCLVLSDDQQVHLYLTDGRTARSGPRRGHERGGRGVQTGRRGEPEREEKRR